MKSETLIISVQINKREANELINVLARGTDNRIEPQQGEEGAFDLLALLRGNFQSSTKGINYP